jgi:hypothetical protein
MTATLAIDLWQQVLEKHCFVAHHKGVWYVARSLPEGEKYPAEVIAIFTCISEIGEWIGSADI